MANELGRQALHERRFEEAATLFAQAAELNPDLAEAWNGQAVALAALGRLADAEAAIEAAHARGLDSEDLRANQEWLLRHRPAPATDGSAAPAPPAAGDATPTREPAPGTNPAPVESAEAQRPASAVAAAEDVQVVPPPPPGDVLPLRRTVRLEVSNGTGAGGLARRTAQALTARDAGLTPARLTNHPHFGVEQTELQVREDADAQLQRALVREVVRTLGVSVAVVRVNTLAPGVDARLVLGHDSREAQSAQARGALPPGPVARAPAAPGAAGA
jgi:tetratricopeptide (TPR) repeat protein